MNVARTRELDLCLSCEICRVVCPLGAVSMEYEYGQFVPEIDEVKCTDCGTCLDLCPGYDIDPTDMRHHSVTADMFDGRYLDTYIAYINDLKLRSKATSGGIITGLIIELIKNKEFDADFVLKFNRFENKPAILLPTNSPDVILESTGSKYIPASVYEVINTLKKNPDGKYVIVGTPCQFQGIKNYLKYMKIADKNLLFLGLFCDKTMNYNILRFFSDKYCNPGESVSELIFRSKDKNGWPGDVKLSFDSGREMIIDKSVRMDLKPYFQLDRCLFCLDKSNMAADISCGDCYIPGAGDTLGKSSVVIRTDKGKGIFDKYSHIFTLETTTIEEIRTSQQLSNRRENLENAKYLIKIEGIYGNTGSAETIPGNIPKRLAKLRQHIRWGRQYKKWRIKLALRIQSIKSAAFYTGQVIGAGLAFGEYMLCNAFRKARIDTTTITRPNIIIVGGGLSNKGGQAMTFTVVDQMKKRFPDKNIFLFSTPDFRRPDREKAKYAFKFRPWDIYTAFRLSGLLGKWLIHRGNEWREEKKTEKIIQEACWFIDISGFALSSELGLLTSWYYLQNIMIAKKFAVPYYILPQSIGPFDYPWKYRLFFSPMLRLFLRYPERIFSREEIGANALEKYIEDNVEKLQDIVLQNGSYNLLNIFTNEIDNIDMNIEAGSVGIIPNLRVFERADTEVLMKVYETIINNLLDDQRKVYVLRHSTEDLEICTRIKSLFHGNDDVILISTDLNAIQLENIIKQLDIIIASRYHSIVHAYRNGVPALVIGWANKYHELLIDFRQLNYYFDCRNPIDPSEINLRLQELLKNRDQKSQTINQRLTSIRKTNVFKIFDEYKTL